LLNFYIGSLTSIDTVGGCGNNNSCSKIKDNKMNPMADFQTPVIAIIERQYPDIRIFPHLSVEEPTQPLYIHTPNPQLSIGELRFIAEAAEIRVSDA
jgi:hypothetical protein